MAKKINITAQLNAATTDGILADAGQIFDTKKGKFQEQVNEEFENALEETITSEDTDMVVESIEEGIIHNALRKTKQILTEAEKEQARENIGAVSEQTFENEAVRVKKQNFTSSEKYQARHNISAITAEEAEKIAEDKIYETSVSAPDKLQAVKELSSWLEENPDNAATMNEKIGENYADIQRLYRGTGIEEYSQFSDGNAYAVGAIVLYDGVPYKFVAEHVKGTAWDWNEVVAWSEKKEREEKVGELWFSSSPELNKYVRGLYYSGDLSIAEVNGAYLQIARTVNGTIYNTLYLRKYDSERYTNLLSIEKTYPTKEEALSDWNAGIILSLKNGKEIQLKTVPRATEDIVLTLKPILINPQSIKIPFVASMEEINRIKGIEEQLTNLYNDIETNAHNINLNAESISILSFSNYHEFNKYVDRIYSKGDDIDITIVNDSTIAIAKQSTQGDYYVNGLYLKHSTEDGDRINIFTFEKKYQSKEEALSDWNCGFIYDEPKGLGIKTLGYVVDTVNFSSSLALLDFRVSPRNVKAPIDSLNAIDLIAIKGDMTSIEQRISPLHLQRSVNLLDPSAVNTGGHLSDKGIIYSESYCYSGPIPVNKGVYKQTSVKKIFGQNTVYWRCSHNGALIEKHRAVYNEDDMLLFNIDFDGFVLINVGTTESLSEAMFCKNEEFPEEYVPYFAKMTGVNIPYEEVENIDGKTRALIKQELEQHQEAINPLSGKIISFDGDSICYGAGFKGGYGKIIAERNNMLYENQGVSGGTIRTETYYADGKPRHWISTNVLNLRTDADYIIIEGGVNDSVNGGTMGSFTASYTDDFDTTTFFGAMDALCKNLYERFPGKKVGFVIVHAVQGWSDSRESERYLAALKVLKKWGIPYINLNTECPPFGLLPSENPLRTQYTDEGDGWHPNEEGYIKYYCDKIESWLKTL